MRKLIIHKSRASGNLELPERIMALQLPSNKSRDFWKKKGGGTEKNERETSYYVCYLVAVKFCDRLSLSKRATQKFDKEKSSLKNQNKIDGREERWLKISNSLVDLENSDDGGTGLGKILWKTWTSQLKGLYVSNHRSSRNHSLIKKVQNFRSQEPR